MQLDNAFDMGVATLATYGAKIPFFIADIPSLGVCEFPTPDSPASRIGLQTRFVKDNSVFLVMDVLLHELAHFFVGHKAFHGDAWRRKYMELGGMGVETADQLTVRPSQWTIVCGQCGSLNTTSDDLLKFDFEEFMSACRECDEELPFASWTKAAKPFRLCDITQTSPTILDEITTTGRNLIAAAMAHHLIRNEK